MFSLILFEASNVPTVLSEKCLQPVDAGPCSHFVDRYFFDPEDGQCHPFKVWIWNTNWKGLQDFFIMSFAIIPIENRIIR